MRLHENEEDFRDLCSITAGYIGIPEDAVRRDYYIVSMRSSLSTEPVRKWMRRPFLLQHCGLICGMRLIWIFFFSR